MRRTSGGRHQTGLAAACLTLLVWAPGASLADVDTYAAVTIATDYLFRGVSQTLSGPSLQGEAGVEHEGGWYGYAWASNVRFTDDSMPDDGARLELNFGAGRTISLTDRVSGNLGMTSYLFPDTKPGVQYDYVEWHGSLAVDELHQLAIGYSADVFGSGGQGIFYRLGTGLELPRQLTVGFGVGWYDLEDAYDASYGYVELTAAGSWRDVGWQLAYVGTSGDDAALFQQSTIGERVVLSLSITF